MPDASVMIERAQLLLEQGRAKDAASALKNVLEQDPENDGALSLLARCYFDDEAVEEGIQIIQRAISLDPHNSYYFYLLAFGYYKNNQTVNASESVRKAIQLNPYYAEFYGLLSFILLSTKAFEKSLEAANEGLALEADNITCLNARSRALNKLRRTDDAFQTMQHALAYDPDNEMTHNTMGWNLLEKGRHKEASTHFLEALRLNPNQESSKVGLKEALKSKLPPYRWLLQYSFWIHNKGRKLQLALPIVLYVIFRVLFSVFRENDATVAWAFGGIYLLMVVTSWSINSIANFVLLFNSIGKYALTKSEKWSAISVVSTLVLGLFVIILALFTNLMAGTAYEGNILFAGLICLSLALPLSDLKIPLQFSRTNKRQLYSNTLALLGITSLLLFLLFPSFVLLFVVYGILFIIYNWMGVTR